MAFPEKPTVQDNQKSYRHQTELDSISATKEAGSRKTWKK